VTRIGAFNPDQAQRVWAATLAHERSVASRQSVRLFNEPEHFPFFNNSGHTIPPYGIFLVDGTNEENGINYLIAKRYSGSAATQSFPMVNGPFEVKDEEFGSPQIGPIYRVIHDGSSYAIGSRVGWKVNSFLATANSNFRVLGNDDIEVNCLRVARDFTDTQAIRRNWLGTLTLGYDGVVGGFWVTPTKALDGVLPTGSQWVVNLYKWDYGALGAVVRVEQDGGRWIPLQQEYSCPPDSPPSEPLGACNYYDPESGSVCAIMTEAACDLQSGGTWTEGGTC
jgi:hypothetical protein